MREPHQRGKFPRFPRWIVGAVMTALASLLATAALAFVIGWVLAGQRASTERRHERAIGQFAASQALRPGAPTADLSDVIIAFDGVRLRHVGTDRSGVDVYVNAEPFPNVTAIAVENLPSQSAIVIIGDQP
jgi:hypothetical protein